MDNNPFSTNGFSDSQRRMAARVPNADDGALAVRLRYKMVQSRFSQTNGDIDLTIALPHTLADRAAAQWVKDFFSAAFAGKQEDIRFDEAAHNGTLGVHLTGAAASRYRSIMQNLDIAEQSIEKDASFSVER